MHQAARSCVVLLAGLIAACAGTVPPPPTAPPTHASTGPGSSVPEVGLDWASATVERPPEAFPLPSGPDRTPSGTDTAGHPGHFPGQAVMADVVATKNGLVAVGWVGTDWRPIAWRSTDGRSWQLDRIVPAGGGVRGFAVRVAAAGDAVVAVGNSGGRAAAWTADAVTSGTWREATVDSLATPGDAERMTAVASGYGLFVAGGSVGPDLLGRHARLWTSADGRAWQPVRDDRSFEGVEIVDIVATPDGWVALGRIGDGQRTTGTTIFRLTDGRSWKRADSPALKGGWARRMAVAADGSIVAVGSDPELTIGSTWSSGDGGATWAKAPDEASRSIEGGRIRMSSVISTRGGFVASGDDVVIQFGQGVTWTSSDGVSWTRSPSQASLNQGEPLALAPTPDGRVAAVGDFGAPDNYIPAAWVSPP